MATAAAAWRTKAIVAPIQTRTGRYRLPMISVAIIVLSGSSATKIRAKTVAAMPRFIDGQRPEERANGQVPTESARSLARRRHRPAGRRPR